MSQLGELLASHPQTTKFGKIFDAYKARKGDLEGVRFQIDGQALQQDRTPGDALG